VVIAIALLAIVGCGQQDGAVVIEASAGFLASAADRTTAASTGRFEAEMELGARAAADSLGITTRASGEYDATLHRASVDDDVDDRDGAYGDALGVRMVIDGEVVYLWGVPGYAGRWVQSALEEGTRGEGSLGPGNETMDPVAMLEYLKGASDDIVEVGRSSVRGVPTTQFGGTLSLARAAEESTSEAAVTRLTEVFGDLDDQRTDFLVDIDTAGLVRRIHMTFTFAPASGSVFGEAFGFDLEYTVEYFDFGDEIEILLPPADQRSSWHHRSSASSTMRVSFADTPLTVYVTPSAAARRSRCGARASRRRRR
jgi:hypothetical protein